MKVARAISSPVAFDVRGGVRKKTAPRTPGASALLMGKLRKTMARAGQWVTGVDPEMARARFLAEATDPADLERRVGAWEQMQDTRRALPLVL